MPKTLVDTNILIRLITNDNKELVKKALLELKGKLGIVSSIVLAESVFVLTSQYGYKRKDVLKMEEFFDIAEIELEERSINLKAIKIFARTKLHFVDSWLLAKSQLSSIPIATLDLELKKSHG